MTKDELVKAREKNNRLNQENLDQAKELEKVQHELRNLQILVHIKDSKIEELKEELYNGSTTLERNHLRYYRINHSRGTVSGIIR